MAPLPLHGQVRPIKVEQEQEQTVWSPMEHHHDSLSSTPPILRRRARKRDLEEEKLDQVDIHVFGVDKYFLIGKQRTLTFYY